MLLHLLWPLLSSSNEVSFIFRSKLGPWIQQTNICRSKLSHSAKATTVIRFSWKVGKLTVGVRNQYPLFSGNSDVGYLMLLATPPRCGISIETWKVPAEGFWMENSSSSSSSLVLKKTGELVGCCSSQPLQDSAPTVISNWLPQLPKGSYIDRNDLNDQ